MEKGGGFSEKNGGRCISGLGSEKVWLGVSRLAGKPVISKIVKKWPGKCEQSHLLSACGLTRGLNGITHTRFGYLNVNRFPVCFLPYFMSTHNQSSTDNMDFLATRVGLAQILSFLIGSSFSAFSGVVVWAWCGWLKISSITGRWP